jgi:hypothetical protein
MLPGIRLASSLDFLYGTGKGLVRPVARGKETLSAGNYYNSSLVVRNAQAGWQYLLEGCDEGPVLFVPQGVHGVEPGRTIGGV